jgi:hypothetical protein
MIAQDKDTGEIMATKENLEWIEDEYKSRTDDT